MICYLKNKTSVNRIMPEEDTATSIVLFSTNYFKLPHQTIICLFPEDMKNLNQIFDDHVCSDRTKEDFRKLCKAAGKKTTWVCNH